MAKSAQPSSRSRAVMQKLRVTTTRCSLLTYRSMHVSFSSSNLRLVRATISVPSFIVSLKEAQRLENRNRCVVWRFIYFVCVYSFILETYIAPFQDTIVLRGAPYY